VYCENVYPQFFGVDVHSRQAQKWRENQIHKHRFRHRRQFTATLTNLPLPYLPLDFSRRTFCVLKAYEIFLGLPPLIPLQVLSNSNFTEKKIFIEKKF
jgi:hypothetical protein